MRKGLRDAATGARAAEDAAKAATDLNKITREAYVADQRPWVSVDLKPDSGGRLVVDQNGDVTADIAIFYKALLDNYRFRGRTVGLIV